MRSTKRRRFPLLRSAEGLATMTPAMEGAHNYFRWIYETLAPHIRGRVLEIGSGFGVFSSVLAREHALVATDFDPRSIEVLERRFAENPNVRVRRMDVLDLASVESVAHEDQDVETVVSLNVLEHLEDDVRALRHMARLVPPGGRIVLFVPALETLYGSLDRLAGHFRRYDRALLARRFEAASLRPLSFRFFNMVGAIGWFMNGCLIPQTRLDAKAVNGQARIYDRYVVGLASALERHVAPPFGQSIIGVAERV